ncbi:unnamed protein product [Cylindrotheca closterium]|uniref:Uncharacterized protein n=1 Tax=Cylindrotheca closterium TaxID=2856 RepID=A0AAD2FUL1_9STRA|nr:unnamed protein product [Cylindrotheca closterium]
MRSINFFLTLLILAFAPPTIMAGHGKGNDEPTTSPAPTLKPTGAPTYTPTSSSTNSRKSSKKSGGMARTTSSVGKMETENASESTGSRVAQETALTVALGVSILFYIY